MNYGKKHDPNGVSKGIGANTAPDQYADYNFINKKNEKAKTGKTNKSSMPELPEMKLPDIGNEQAVIIKLKKIIEDQKVDIKNDENKISALQRNFESVSKLCL